MAEKDEQNEHTTEPSEFDLDQAAEALEFPDMEVGEGDEADGVVETDPLAEMTAERDALDDKLRRMMADYQNFARRAEQNVVVARQQTLMEMAKQLVTVLDHFDHALAADPEKSSVDDLLKGVGIVHEELLRTLGSFGIQKLNVEPGELFDPNRHEALMRQPHDEIESNHVTAQMQPGYVIDDKTIRPAKVAIAE